MAGEVFAELGDLQVAAFVLDHRDRAHVLAVVVVIQANLYRRMARNGQRDDPVSLPPIGHALVDESVDTDPLEVFQMIAVDVQKLARRIRPCTIVPCHVDVRCAVEVPEGVPEGLHGTLVAIGQLEETPKVQVDARRLCFPEHATEKTPFFLSLPRRPVQVAHDSPVPGLPALLERDLFTPLLKRDLR